MQLPLGRPHPLTRALIGSLVAVGLLALGACASSDAPRGASEEPSSVPLVRVSETPASSAPRNGIMSIPKGLQPRATPIEAYLATPQQEATLDYAQQVMAARCMLKRGFTVKVAKFDDLAAWYAQDATYTRSRWFGLTDAKAAGVYGYGDPEMLPQSTVDNTAALSDPDAAAAWDGDSANLQTQLGNDPEESGCNRGSEMQLLGKSGLDLTQSGTAEKIRNDASAKAQATPAYAAVFNEFGVCLRNAGYDVPDPQRPFASKQMQQINSGMDRKTGTPAPAAEVKLAETDIRCKQKINMVRRLEQIVTHGQEQLIETDALALDEEQKQLDRSLKRAAAIIEGSE